MFINFSTVICGVSGPCSALGSHSGHTRAAWRARSPYDQLQARSEPIVWHINGATVAEARHTLCCESMLLLGIEDAATQYGMGRRGSAISATHRWPPLTQDMAAYGEIRTA